MSRIMKIVAAASLAVMAATAANAQDCTPAHDITTLEEGKLTVGVWNYPPFSMIDANNVAGGIDYEIVRVAAEANCLELVPLNLSTAAAVQSIVSGKADVAIGGWYRSLERSKVLGLTLPTYIDAMTSISKDGIDTVDGMMDKSVGSVQGYTWNGTLQEVFGANLKLYPDGLAMYSDLEAGRLDVALDGSVAPIEAMRAGRLQGFKTALVQSDERIPDTVAPPQSTLLYTMGNAELGAALDDAVTKVHAEGILKQWLTDAGYDPAMADVGEPRLVQ